MKVLFLWGENNQNIVESFEAVLQLANPTLLPASQF